MMIRLNDWFRNNARRPLSIALGMVLVLLSGMVIATLFLRGETSQADRKLIKIAVPGPWNTLHPGLQHSLFGDLVLSNQFEALVGVNDSGVSIPLGAKSWVIADDFRTIKFHIDTSRTFSDGSRLSAHDFKRSWETSAKLDPVSANNSLLDVLYKIEGFNELKSKGSIKGLIVEADDQLTIRFTSPFRQALEHLQGNRFAAFRESGKAFIGTGVFLIEEISKDRLRLIPRSDLKIENVPEMEVHFVPSSQIGSLLSSGQIDAIHYTSGHVADQLPLVEQNIGVITGHSSFHIACGLNTNPSSIFASPQRRRALQTMLFDALSRSRGPLPPSPLFDIDFQFYLPFQSGRLKSDESQALIGSGAPYVRELISASHKQPILIKTTASLGWFIDYVESLGLAISKASSSVTSEEYFKLVYAQNGPDILVGNFSVASGDPDGIYHVLGKNGAIRTPYIYSASVGDLLEQGRNMTNIDGLDEHYKKVSRALLTEVPMIHLGFAKALTLYRKDRVEIDTQVLRRNQGQLHFLKAK